MKIKSKWYLALLVILVLSVTACSSQEDMMESESLDQEVVSMEEEVVEEPIIITLEELATFDGKDGQAAYVAVDGIVYDVTGIPAWTDGEHNGNMAGKDLSKEILNAPHGKSKLSDLSIVGQLEE